jgi:hypothetical protein
VELGVKDRENFVDGLPVLDLLMTTENKIIAMTPVA